MLFTYNRARDSHVFYDIEYLVRRLEQFFSVLTVAREAYGYQTALLLEKSWHGP